MELVSRGQRILTAAFVMVGALANSGCLMNGWSSDSNQRLAQMATAGEDRQVKYPLHWFADQPTDATPIRVHGGIGPGGP